MGNSSMSPEYLQAYLLFREEWVILVHYVASSLLKTIRSCQLGVVRYFGTSLSSRARVPARHLIERHSEQACVGAGGGAGLSGGLVPVRVDVQNPQQGQAQGPHYLSPRQGAASSSAPVPTHTEKPTHRAL